MDVYDYIENYLPNIFDVNEIKFMLAFFKATRALPWPRLIEHNDLIHAAHQAINTQYAQIDSQSSLEKAIARGIIVKIKHLNQIYYAPTTHELEVILNHCKLANSKSSPYKAMLLSRMDEEAATLVAQMAVRFRQSLIDHVLRQATPQWTWESVFIEIGLTEQAQHAIEDGGQWEIHGIDHLLNMYVSRFGHQPTKDVAELIRKGWTDYPDISLWRKAFHDARNIDDVLRTLQSISESDVDRSRDGIYNYVVSQYKKRVNPWVDPAIRRRLSDLCRRYPDITKWEQAFAAAANANAMNLNYIAAVLQRRCSSGFSKKI